MFCTENFAECSSLSFVQVSVADGPCLGIAAVAAICAFSFFFIVGSAGRSGGGSRSPHRGSARSVSAATPASTWTAPPPAWTSDSSDEKNILSTARVADVSRSLDAELEIASVCQPRDLEPSARRGVLEVESVIDDEYHRKCLFDEYLRVTSEERCQGTRAKLTLNIDAGEEDEQALPRTQCYREESSDCVLSQRAESQCLDVAVLQRWKQRSKSLASDAAPGETLCASWPYVDEGWRNACAGHTVA